jgi:hypothetical protein
MSPLPSPYATENEAQVTRGIEMMLLVKTEGRWQIVSQAWDTEGVSKPIPADLLRSPWQGARAEPPSSQ